MVVTVEDSKRNIDGGSRVLPNKEMWRNIDNIVKFDSADYIQ
jgi:hypothetical protein